MAGVFSLLIALSVSLLVNRIATMALMFTGMSREAAKFQARSAFSGVGYPTVEAEAVVNHPVRRRIVMLLMLLGNIGIATIIATVMLSVSSATGMSLNRRMLNLFILCIGLFGLFLLSSSRTVERQMNKVIAWALKRFTDLDTRDYASLLQLAGGYSVSEMLAERRHWFVERALKDLRLSDEGILVLGIHRTGGGYQGIPGADDAIQVGDRLIVYGNMQHVHALDRRRSGADGDAEHLKSVEQQEERERSQKWRESQPVPQS